MGGLPVQAMRRFSKLTGRAKAAIWAVWSRSVKVPALNSVNKSQTGSIGEILPRVQAFFNQPQICFDVS
jgi:hypothetical protein